MKRFWIALLVLGCAATTSWAAVEKTAGGTSTAAPQTWTTGTISTLGSNQLKISGATGPDTEIALDSSTSVWKGGKPSSLAELKVGEKVKVGSVSKDGKQVAKSIKIE